MTTTAMTARTNTATAVNTGSVVPARQMMLMSIHPVHIANMRLGTKTVELRRTRPAVTHGQPVILYSTTPQAALVAVCRIEQIQAAAPTNLWPMIEPHAAIDQAHYDSYFGGAHTAVALHLAEFIWLQDPITLTALRSRRGFHPPQTWHFLDRQHLATLIGDHPDAAAVLALLPDDSTGR